MSTGASICNAGEGADDFGAKELGPQKRRILRASQGDAGGGMAADPASGIGMPADMRGKRLATIAGGAALDNPIRAKPARGGLTKEEGAAVELSGYGYGDAIDGRLAGNVDTTVPARASRTGARAISSPKAFARAPPAAPRPPGRDPQGPPSTAFPQKEPCRPAPPSAAFPSARLRNRASAMDRGSPMFMPCRRGNGPMVQGILLRSALAAGGAPA